MCLVVPTARVGSVPARIAARTRSSSAGTSRSARRAAWTELLRLFQVSTGDSWVARNGDSVSRWTADTALAVLLEDLKVVDLKGLVNGIPMPFTALFSTLLFDAWGQKP